MPQQRLFAVMQQGKVIIRIRVLMGLDGLREVGDNRVKCPLLIEPMRKEMHAHVGQMGPHPDDLCARGRRPTTWVVARTALGPIALPPTPQPIEMANTDLNGCMSLGDFVAQESPRALWVVVECFPYQGLLDVTELSASTKGWTGRWIELTLVWGEGHDLILLDTYFWIKSARSPL